MTTPLNLRRPCFWPEGFRIFHCFIVSDHLRQMYLNSLFALCGYATQSTLRTFRVPFFTKIRDRIEKIRIIMIFR